LLTLAGVVGLAVFAPEPGGRAGLSRLAPAARSAGADSSLPTRVTVQNEGRKGILSDLPERRTLGDPKVDLFGPHSWRPPQRKVVAPPPPPPPPPMTYRFAGRLVQADKVQVFVSNGKTPVAVKPGDTLEGGYVVESITADAIRLSYPRLGYETSISVPRTFTSQASAPPSTADSIPAQAATNFPAPATERRRQVQAPFAAVPQANRTAARLQWEGPAQVRLGSEFSVRLRVEADQPISGSPMQVRFDPAILESVSVRPGKLFAAEAGRGFNYRINPRGAIYVGATTPSASADSEAELLVLTFRPLKPRTQTEVSLTALNLQGPTGRSVPHDAPASFRIAVTH